MCCFTLLYDLITYFLLFNICRRQVERNKLAREKQLREAAEREKAVMEQKLLQYQEEVRLANEALVCRILISARNRAFLSTFATLKCFFSSFYFRDDQNKLQIF